METLPEEIIHRVLHLLKAVEVRRMALISRHLRTIVIDNIRFSVPCDDYERVYFERLSYAQKYQLPISFSSSGSGRDIYNRLEEFWHLVIEIVLTADFFLIPHRILGMSAPRLRSLHVTRSFMDPEFVAIPRDLFQGNAPKLAYMSLNFASMIEPVAAFDNVRYVRLTYDRRTPYMDLKRHFPRISSIEVSYSPVETIDLPDFNLDISGLESCFLLDIPRLKRLIVPPQSKDLLRQLSNVALISWEQPAELDTWLWTGISGRVVIHANSRYFGAMFVRGEAETQRKVRFEHSRSPLSYGVKLFSKTLAYLRIDADSVQCLWLLSVNTLPMLETIHIDVISNEINIPKYSQAAVIQCDNLHSINLSHTMGIHNIVIIPSKDFIVTGAAAVAGIARLLGQENRASGARPILNIHGFRFEDDTSVLQAVFSNVVLHELDNTFPSPTDLSATESRWI